MAKETCKLFIRKAMPAGRIPLGNGSGRAAISAKKQVLAFGTLELLSCSDVFTPRGETGPRRNGRMEQNFPVIPMFQNIWTTTRGTPKIPK